MFQNTKKWIALLMTTALLLSGNMNISAAVGSSFDEAFVPTEYKEQSADNSEAEDSEFQEAEPSEESDSEVTEKDAPRQLDDLSVERDEEPKNQDDAEVELPEISTRGGWEEGEQGVFTVIGIDEVVYSWSDRNLGAMTLGYFKEYDPEQTFRVSCESEWTLFDPEGMLREVSSNAEETVYAMLHPTWEQPCLFTSGDTVMPLYILFPPDGKYDLVLYDESLPLDHCLSLTALSNAQLKPGQQVDIAFLCRFPGMEQAPENTNPLDAILIEGAATVLHEPGAPYFTLIPEEEGIITLTIQQGVQITLWVSEKELVQFVTFQYGNIINDGQELRSTVHSVLRDSTWSLLQGISYSIHSSNPDVIAVELDDSDPDCYFLTPVGFGEATIYLDSDLYYGEVTLLVKDWQITMDASPGNYASIGLLPGDLGELPTFLPRVEFEGTPENPFIIPTLTEVGVTEQYYLYLWEPHRAGQQITSSNPNIVKVVEQSLDYAYLEPVNPGICTITYQQGPFLKEVVVQSAPGYLDESHFSEPGFYTYYGAANVRRDSVVLEGSQSVLMGVIPTYGLWELEELDPERFHFSVPGIVRVDIVHGFFFQLFPEQQGVTTLTYITQAGVEYVLQVDVDMPDALYEFVLADKAKETGYRLWQNQQIIVGEQSEQEVFFARVVVAADGDVIDADILPFPQDIQIQAPDSTVFDLVQKEGSWYVCAAPVEPGEYTLHITGTPPDSASPQTWGKNLRASTAIVVTENTVAAINEAIQTAEIRSGYETVILLPSGYIPMDYYTPVVLDRPVTLRGQDTILSSDIVAMCQIPGAKLENLTVQFTDGSYWYMPSRVNYPILSSNFPYNPDYTDQNIFGIDAAIRGDGILALENCELDGGTGRWRAYHGIAVHGGRVTFHGVNTIRHFYYVGWCVESTPGPRRTFQGITFQSNYIAVCVIPNGSTDPYFIRLTQSNFIDNSTNVYSPYPVDFSYNYFARGVDEPWVNKSPQYTQPLVFDPDGSATEFPILYIEPNRLASAELLNFEGQSPIDTANFAASDDPVQITVRELGSAYVYENDHSNILLHWAFPPSASENSPLFRPDAYIDEAFELPAGSGIEAYQGISFAHHGPLPMEGATIRVLKKALFEEETLHLYRLANGGLTYLGEIENTSDEFYTFFLDSCSDYVITNVVVESAGSGDGNGSNNSDRRNKEGEGENVSDSEAPSEIEADLTIKGDAFDTPFSKETHNPTTENRVGESRLDTLSANEHFSGNTGPATYTYAHIPAPLGRTTSSQTISANRYVDDAAIRTAFDNPRDGQVVIDVSVRTTISPLAFQLLSENPTLTLSLKGDGYEWQFSGADISAISGLEAFDSTVIWQQNQDEGFSQLSFAQQHFLPNNCQLILESVLLPKKWGQYSALQKAYIPCTISAQLKNNRLMIELKSLESYAAIL